METSNLTRLRTDASMSGDQRALLFKAREFLNAFPWCNAIQTIYVGCIVEGVVGVFLFEIIPSAPEIDKQLWVVVGDLPPAYLVTDQAQDPASALKLYIKEMKAWVIAVKSGSAIDHIIPVNAKASMENAAALDSRLNFLAKKVVRICGKGEQK